MNKVFAVSTVVIKELVRRKDFYVLFVLTGILTLMMGSISFFEEQSIVRYVKEICLMLIWASTLVIAVTTAARQIPAERESRTIFPLLAKPISRTQVMMGKFLGCWFAVGIALLVFYGFFAVISIAREQDLSVLNYIQALWMHWMMLGIVIACTLVGSLLLTPSANVSVMILVALAILLVGEFLNQVASRSGGLGGMILYLAYFCIPHLELFDLRQRVIHGWEPVSFQAIGLASVYAMVYMALFLTGASLIFRRKPLN